MSLAWYLTYSSFSDFSNILNKTAIERLAQADEYEVVREVQVRTSTYITYINTLLIER